MPARAKETSTKRPSNTTLDKVGVGLVFAGVVIGLVVSFLRMLPTGAKIGLLVFALVLVAVGLLLNLKFRSPQA